MPSPSRQQQTAALTPDLFAQAYVNGFHQTTRFLLSKGASLDVAEEVAQGAWVRGWEARDQLQIQDRLLPWINTIAYHGLCTDHRRSERYSELTDLADSRSPEPIAALDSEILMNRCSAFEKALLTQRYVDGMALKAIAVTHGLSELAVRLRIHRCRRSLRSVAARDLRNTDRGYQQRRPGHPATEGDAARFRLDILRQPAGASERMARGFPRVPTRGGN